jgi:hypothetical protein
VISGTTARLSRLGCVLLFLAGLGAEPLLAQEVPPPSPEVQARLAEFQARRDETERWMFICCELARQFAELNRVATTARTGPPSGPTQAETPALI